MPIRIEFLGDFRAREAIEFDDDQQRVVIGRHPVLCQVIFDDPFVGRVHCELRRDLGGYVLVALPRHIVLLDGQEVHGETYLTERRHRLQLGCGGPKLWLIFKLDELPCSSLSIAPESSIDTGEHYDPAVERRNSSQIELAASPRASRGATLARAAVSGAAVVGGSIGVGAALGVGAVAGGAILACGAAMAVVAVLAGPGVVAKGGAIAAAGAERVRALGSRLALAAAQAAPGPSTLRGDFSDAPHAPRDTVDCTLFATPQARRGDSILVQVHAHLPDDTAAAAALATEFDSNAKPRGCTSLGTEVARGSWLAFELTIRALGIDSESRKLRWAGATASVAFDVNIPASTKSGDIVGTVVVLQDSVPIGQITFKICVVRRKMKRSDPIAAGATATRIRSAFASYASQDRAEVTKRVQMARAAGIRCFQDVLDLDPGDRWERKLYHRIDESDTLFLFWSNHARQSTWVEKEWRYALEKRGLDFIRPVIIEGPPVPAPPSELAALHFNDRMLYLLAATGDKATTPADQSQSAT